MIRILIFTYQPFLSIGLKATLRASAEEFHVVDCQGDIESLLDQAQSDKPDLLVVDVDGPLGLDDVVVLQGHLPGMRVVVWVSEASPRVAHRALQLGVRGILLKTLPLEAVVRCLRVVTGGGLWFGETLRFDSGGPITAFLTDREDEVLGLVVRGWKNKDIARALSIKEATVKVYVSSLLRKLGIRGRGDLVSHGKKRRTTTDVFADSAKPGGVEGSRTPASQWTGSLASELPN